MRLRKKIQKIASSLALFLLCFTVFGAMTAEADFASDVKNMFSVEDEGLTFTDFKGGLSSLPTEGFDEGLVASTDLREFVIKIVNFALSFLGLLAVLIVIYGGVLYVSSAGEDEKTEKGKSAITYAVIGLLIVLGSYAFVNTIIRGATGPGTTGTTVVGVTSAVGFNASSEQVRSLAIEIVDGYAFLAEATEEVKYIQNELQKDSLYPANYPSKGEILSFLQDTRLRLESMKAKVNAFSASVATINELERKIDRNIDSIRNKTATAYVVIDPKAGGGFTESVCEIEFRGITDIEATNCTKGREYIVGLAEEWSEIRQDMISTSGGIATIIDPIKSDYAIDLKSALLKVDNSYKGLENIPAIGGQNARARVAYATMKTNFGYDVRNNEVVATTGGFLEDIESKWDVGPSGISIEDAGRKMLIAMENLAIVYEEFKTLQYVEARLTADTINGNAPLTVIFDALASNDPAGGSLQADNIIWDLAGTLTLEELQNELGYGPQIIGADSSGVINGTVDCNITSRQDELLPSTSQRCRFDKPGTYLAAIKIRSNDETKYAPGISVLQITVRPPATKIDLAVEQSGHPETEQVLSRYENDLLIADRKQVTFTLEQAKDGDGIFFDASGTDAERFQWIFSDGRGSDLETAKTFSRTFKETGSYEATLEVINPLGAVDRKIFTIEIRDIAARISMSTSKEAFVNTPITFDGSASKSDSGRIAEYHWIIEPADWNKWNREVPAEQRDLYPVDERGSNLSSIKHEFRFPMDYNVTLAVTDVNGESSDTTVTMEIESQPPVAQYTYEIKDPTQPGTVYFNADTSYDPDGDDELLAYEWSVDADSDLWRFVQDTSANSKKPIIKFAEKGEYEVALKVSTVTAGEEADEIIKTVEIDNNLDIAWADDQEVTGILDDSGRAEMSFNIVSENAIAYEIDFGDGEMSSGDIAGAKSITHTYNEAGRYTVEVTVFDEEDYDNSIQRRIFIGGGNTPIAKIGLRVNGVNISDLSDPIEVNRRDVLTFDASESVNVDGTGRRLNYSWNFGDTDISSNKTATHSYQETSPADPGYFTVTLKVYDDDDSTLSDEDEIKIRVLNEPPRFSSIQGIVQDSELTTPVNVTVKAFGEIDPDGRIVQYKWWYFDITDPEEVLGVQITTGNTAVITIGTRGLEGEEKTYGLGLEITDSDNLKFSSEQLYSLDTVPTVNVINGYNALPIAKFNVNSTTVKTGDEVEFTSASTDEDGTIVSYVWDVEGDGFFNNAPTKSASITHVYTDRNLDGYNVRLKVIDDKAGESVSDPIRIYVDSQASAPSASFDYEVVAGSAGKKINFINKSSADTEAGARIINYSWDFDTISNLPTADSDGDGSKDNDTDSRAENPSRLYTEYGTYRVKLTVTDSQGNTDVTAQQIEIVEPEPDAATEPETNLKAILETNPAASSDKVVYLPGESASVTLDFSKSQGLINYYIIDKNIYFDTDGNGINDDDEDFKTTLPGRWSTNFEEAWGRIVIKLTIQDIYGNKSTALQEIKFQ